MQPDLRCSPAGRCAFHRDGGAEAEKCPGMCDAPGCSLDAFYEVGKDRVMCAAHGGIVLLARAVREALVADGDEDAKGGE
ncbi:MAG: hypothetical protein ACJ8F1_14090 [Polyangia bacterium]